MDPAHSLRALCEEADSLFDRSDEEILYLVHKEFPEELERLRRADSSRGGSWTPPNTPSPSYILYKKDHDEVNNIIVAILALRWIYTGQYETFVTSQPAEAQLTRASFDWIRTFYKQNIVDGASLFTLITSVIIGALGKDPQLASDCCAQTGANVSTLNYNTVLHEACKAGLVQKLERLADQDRFDVLRGTELGVAFNFGQLAQAENVPASLAGLLKMRSHDRSFKLYFMKELLDVSGALGHMSWTCARKLTQPIFDSYCNVYDACEGIISGDLTVRSGYDLVLSRKAESLRDQNVRVYYVKDRVEDRALIRLLCMGNVVTADKAFLYEGAWRALEDPIRETLVRGLNLDGKRSEPAVIPTHMSAFLDHVRDENALVCTLRYLAQILSATDVGDPLAVVIERRVDMVLKQVIESKEFKEDPSILKMVDVPDSVVALTTASL